MINGKRNATRLGDPRLGDPRLGDPRLGDPGYDAPAYASLTMAGILLASLLGLAACESPQQRVSEKEDHLAAAGFVVQPANTPQRQAMLSRLPPHKFLQRPHGNETSFVYADPLVCDCLYVGSQQAYDRYKLYLEQKQLADERQTTAELYSDSAWDWGYWGPWYPGFGPGPGW
jgi:hypothetical protein